MFIEDLYIREDFNKSLQLLKNDGIQVKNFMELLSLRSAIPTEIKMDTNDVEFRNKAKDYLTGVVNFHKDDQTFSLKESSCKLFYSYLI